jgi:hypothetical protein
MKLTIEKQSIAMLFSRLDLDARQTADRCYA